MRLEMANTRTGVRGQEEGYRPSLNIGSYKQDPNQIQEAIEPTSPLYKGMDDYANAYQSKIADFEKKYGSDTSIPAAAKTNANRTFFRELFVKYAANFDQQKEPSFKGTPESRATDPNVAAIEMKKIFGKEGAELYRLALEEEMHSKEYREAVYKESSTSFTGQKWTERPVVIVGGPSASGKTTAAKAAIVESEKFIKKDTNTDPKGKNWVIAVDGGAVREVSQMRKLAIKLSNNKGFSGIKDLHSESNVLEDVKARVYEHALTKSHGIVIPETFSSFFFPLQTGKKMLEDLLKLTNAKTIFARVEGKNKEKFQQVVEYMGSSRAWAYKPEDFNNKDSLNDLNARPKCESKAYGPTGFWFGENGSINAEEWYKANAKEPLVLTIKNDLILKREESSGNWVDAKYGEPGVVMLSERAFNAWEAEKKQSSPRTLEQYLSQALRPPTLIKSPALWQSYEFKENFLNLLIADNKNKIKQGAAPDAELMKISFTMQKFDVEKASVKDISAYNDEIKKVLQNPGKNKDSKMLEALEKYSNALDKLCEQKKAQPAMVSFKEIETHARTRVESGIDALNNLPTRNRRWAVPPGVSFEATAPSSRQTLTAENTTLEPPKVRPG